MDNKQLSNDVIRDLRSTVADLETVNPWIGLWRFCSLGLLVLGFVILAWTSHRPILFFGYTAIAGVFYAFWFICSHDAVHRTLTGWTWFDDVLPRLVGYPMLWVPSAYAYLHRLHHGWNGINLQDPERVQWTVAEYEQASPLTQWYVRHQWVIDLLIFGGFGMIAKTILKAVRLGHEIPVLHRLLLLDAVGIFVAQTICVLIAASYHRLWDYVLFWLVLERIIGIIVQARDHLEHYGLWGKASRYQFTQLYACRNLKTNALVTWLMGGLSYHSVHHAFPQIPFNRLSEAFDRVQAVLEHHGLPTMTVGAGYVSETLELSFEPSLIGDAGDGEITGRFQMVTLV
jgi:fatty acid desaturase